VRPVIFFTVAVIAPAPSSAIADWSLRPAALPCETLLKDSTRLAAAAGSANVDVTLEIWPDMIHARPMWNALLEAGRRALARAGEFVHRHLFKV
jgi:acetyl esterase/lipase